jgi:protein-tyrosine phosphatase
VIDRPFAGLVESRDAVVDDDDRYRVLFVCTANQCRSPLGAALLRAQLLARVPDVAVEVTSSGVSASAGAGATPLTIGAAAALEVDLRPHRSTLLDDAQVRTASLIIGMERRHVQEAVLLDPSAFSRSFTLKELVRRGREIGRRGSRESLADWTARVGLGRRRVDLLGPSRDDDIADPTTNPLVDHHSTAVEINDLVSTLVDLMWSPLGFDTLTP